MRLVLLPCNRGSVGLFLPLQLFVVLSAWFRVQVSLDIHSESTLNNITVFFYVVIRSDSAEEKFSGCKVFHDCLCSLDLVGKTTTGNPTTSGSIQLQEGRHSVESTLTGRQLHFVLNLQHLLGDPRHQQLDGVHKVTHRVNWQHTATHHFSFRVSKRGEYKTRTITQLKFIVQEQGLEMLCLAWQGGNTHLLLANEHVNNRRFTDVRVSNGTHCESFDLLVSLAKSSESLMRLLSEQAKQHDSAVNLRGVEFQLQSKSIIFFLLTLLLNLFLFVLNQGLLFELLCKRSQLGLLLLSFLFTKLHHLLINFFLSLAVRHRFFVLIVLVVALGFFFDFIVPVFLFLLIVAFIFIFGVGFVNFVEL